MADKAILSAACELVGCQPADVLDWKEYEDRIVLVLTAGPKHTIFKADVAPPKHAPKKRASRK